jgi:excisionase family DNA binding protein
MGDAAVSATLPLIPAPVGGGDVGIDDVNPAPSPPTASIEVVSRGMRTTSSGRQTTDGPPRTSRLTPTRRRPNPRLVKIHRNYSVDEAARVLGTHKNTIRTWLKQGLPTIDQRRPTLIHGVDLSAFVKNRRNRAKRPCPPGHMYCFKCRSPKKPAADMADYLPITATSGNLRALCPDCGTFMHRRAAFAKLNMVGANLDIAFPQAVSRIGGTPYPSLNDDLSKDDPTHAITSS